LTGKISDLEQEVISCRRCPRLVAWRERMGREKRRAYRAETYWAKPVPGFGDEKARVLAVGLAPGAHGSNRTGRMFTGDASGDFLYPALHRAGYADRPRAAARDDGLTLRGMFITAVVRCVPPGNKPSAEEIRNCLPFLAGELRLLRDLRVLVALGRIAYESLLRLPADREGGLGDWGAFPGAAPPFAHGAIWLWRSVADAPDRWLIAAYHPSRQNTQTGRLTRVMYDRLWRKVRKLADG
jgi:uracil-DNA glycosylase family 4